MNKQEIEKDHIIEQLKDLVKIQTAHGNWNYDPYMMGLANGLILALAIAQNKKPDFLESPKEWLKDKPETENPIAQEPVVEMPIVKTVTMKIGKVKHRT
jgi:hypothetical protein